MKSIRALGGLLLAATTLLTACGGGGSDPNGLFKASDIDASTSAVGAQQLTGRAMCDVQVEHLSYSTLDPQGRSATATTALMVPTGSGANCSGARPVLLYAHGTTTLKSYNMADPVHNPEAFLVMAFYAAHGYVVVAPNYLGYDGSSLPYHPYLNAGVQARDMVDGLRASLTQLGAASGTTSSGRIVIAGYSQGGHVAMATHRLIESTYASEFNVVAAGPMSGPYNLVKFGNAVVGGDINIGATLFMPYLLTSYQNAYGNIYTTPSQAYQAPFDKTAPTLFPTDTPVATLMAEGALPNDPTFKLLFGAGGLLTETFRDSYQGSAFQAALAANTLLGWTPKAPVTLCGGDQDPTVFFFNATDMQADFATRNVMVPVFDLEDRASLPAGIDADAIYAAFQTAKAISGDKAAARYHGELVPPACYALMRGFFAQALGGS